MNLVSCACRQELKAALKAGHWPAACDPVLRTHVTACDACSELVLLTQTFKTARGETMQAGRVASPNTLWWRAQLRRRSAAIERIGQPISVATTLAFVGTLLVALSYPVLAWQQRGDWLRWLQTFLKPVAANWGLMLLVPAIGTLTLLGALALYLAAEKS